ncbi:TldD/PmbA family protein [Candidatus Nitrosotenuis uzonensis]|uniref:Peptidase U62 modulator of DNA gyrase n=1 Tax=Candidatus Nitrosotenuis uzonensis TaxID=1407055 RepID=V6AS39_9ARCH|nr:TldD/PmbA family protein [Candidatus Nitrosotenuis uzonensis]CDI05350.1 Peptidase U62 modulator of DNA gyrase [Candidatus Nitrosotenuis uzonensis]
MSVCDDIIARSRHLKVDECEAVMCSKRAITVRITDSEITEIKEGLYNVACVRLIHEKKISAAQSTSPHAGMVDDALASSRYLVQRPFWISLPEDSKCHAVKNINDEKLWAADASFAADIAQEMINSALHSSIANISGSLNIVCDEFEIMNTHGLERKEKSTYISGVINSDSDKTSMPSSGIGQSNSRMLHGFDAASIGAEASQMCSNSLNPKSAEQETTSVIFEPMAVGEILTFVLSPNFSLKTYSEKRSCFSGKIGSHIATQEFSLSDEPHVANGLGSKSFDDEGMPTARRQYVREGVMESTYSDLYNAFKENTVTSGNAIRHGSPLGRAAEPIPIASPHNLSITAGNMTRDELVRQTHSGIIVSRLWYTYAVNPIKGDFSCTARSGIWKIEGGRIIHPLKQVRIVHTLPKLLQSISAIANNPRTVLSWAANPVSAPTIRCDGICIAPT